MQEQDIYGKYGVYLPKILDNLSQRIQEANDRVKQETGQKLLSILMHGSSRQPVWKRNVNARICLGCQCLP